MKNKIINSLNGNLTMMQYYINELDKLIPLINDSTLLDKFKKIKTDSKEINEYILKRLE